MRCYHFCHVYLSDIQKGIQSAHAQMELFVKYPFNPCNNQSIDLYEWATHHKTMICLNGGNSASLIKTKNLLEGCSYPWSVFYEDEDSLNSTITNVAIVLPERIYTVAKQIREDRSNQYLYNDIDPIDRIIVDLLNSHSLA